MTETGRLFLDCIISLYLFVGGSLLLFWDFLIDVEDTWDVELHAVEVISNHSPQLVQSGVTSFCNLGGIKNLIRYGNFNTFWGTVFVTSLEEDGGDDEISILHLHYLPRHVKDAASCSAEEASQPGGGTISDHSSSCRLAFSIKQPPPLLPLLSLPKLQLPLFLMVTQPYKNLLLYAETAIKTSSKLAL